MNQPPITDTLDRITGLITDMRRHIHEAVDQYDYRGVKCLTDAIRKLESAHCIVARQRKSVMDLTYMLKEPY